MAMTAQPAGTLILRKGKSEVPEIQLTESRTTLGRASSVDVTFDEDMVSREHAEILITDTGRFQINDLGSLNGTYLNEKKLDSERPMLLRHNDTIWLGKQVVILTFEEHPGLGTRPTEFQQTNSTIIARPRDKFSTGALEVNLRANEVKLDGINVHLAPKEYEVFVFLISKLDEVCTYADIAKRVWPHEFDEDRYRQNIHSCIAGIRRKIKSGAIVERRTKVGYLLRIPESFSVS